MFSASPCAWFSIQKVRLLISATNPWLYFLLKPSRWSCSWLDRRRENQLWLCFSPGDETNCDRNKLLKLGDVEFLIPDDRNNHFTLFLIGCSFCSLSLGKTRLPPSLFNLTAKSFSFTLHNTCETWTWVWTGKQNLYSCCLFSFVFFGEQNSSTPGVVHSTPQGFKRQQSEASFPSFFL